MSIRTCSVDCESFVVFERNEMEREDSHAHSSFGKFVGRRLHYSPFFFTAKTRGLPDCFNFSLLMG